MQYKYNLFTVQSFNADVRSQDTPVRAELHQSLRRILWVIVITHQTSTALTTGITKGQSLLFYSVDKSPFIGVKGESLRGEDLSASTGEEDNQKNHYS